MAGFRQNCVGFDFFDDGFQAKNTPAESRAFSKPGAKLFQSFAILAPLKFFRRRFIFKNFHIQISRAFV